jgi:hypothetical protein
MKSRKKSQKNCKIKKKKNQFINQMRKKSLKTQNTKRTKKKFKKNHGCAHGKPCFWRSASADYPSFFINAQKKPPRINTGQKNDPHERSEKFVKLNFKAAV